MKRLAQALILAGVLMAADVLALVLVTRAFLPAKPPQWATAPFFWILAWPVPAFARLFAQPASSTDHGPTFLAVALSALVDVTLLTTLMLWIMRRRAGSRASQ